MVFIPRLSSDWACLFIFTRTASHAVLGEKSLHFDFGQLFPATFLQTFKLQPANASTGEALHFKTELIEHQADLALEALFEDDMRAILSDHPGALALGVALFGEHAFDQLGHGGLVHGLIHDHLIFLFGTHTWVNEAVGKFAAICHQQQALAVFIQTAHVMECLKRLGQERVDRHAIPLIAAATDVTARLVQGDDHPALGFDGLAVCDNPVLIGYLGGQVLDHVSIDGDTTFLNEYFATTAGAEAAQAEITVEAHGRWEAGVIPRKLFRFGLWQAGRQATFLPLTAGLHELDALATLKDAALGTNGTGGFEAAMLRHGKKKKVRG